MHTLLDPDTLAQVRCDDRSRGTVAEAQEGQRGYERQGWGPGGQREREREIMLRKLLLTINARVCVCMRLDGSTWAECKRANAFATCTVSPANAFRWHVRVCVCVMTDDKCGHV